MNISNARVIDAGRAVEVELDGRPHRFHAIWLRDNACDAATRSPGNGQRLITILDIPAETRIIEARQGPGGLSLRFEPEGKTIDFEAAWLARHAYDGSAARTPGWTGPDIDRWDSACANEVPSEAWPIVTG